MQFFCDELVVFVGRDRFPQQTPLQWASRDGESAYQRLTDWQAAIYKQQRNKSNRTRRGSVDSTAAIWCYIKVKVCHAKVPRHTIRWQ